MRSEFLASLGVNRGRSPQVIAAFAAENCALQAQLHPIKTLRSESAILSERSEEFSEGAARNKLRAKAAIN